jgi:hypothetical protein
MVTLRSTFVKPATLLGVAAALLAGCGGSAGTAPMPAANALSKLTHHKTYYYSGYEDFFNVPGGVTKLTVIAVGAKGAGSTGALGGRVYAVVPVTPGEKLAIFVGGLAPGIAGGFNGGANGANMRHCSRCSGYGGGGASDVRQGGDELTDRIIVAGGGGGDGASYGSGGGGAGGAGGTSTGADGKTGCCRGYGGHGGHGGTQSSGGAGGETGKCPYASCGDAGDAGSLGNGGTGGVGGSINFNSREYYGDGGGGGGGGYYGGGGGGGGNGYAGWAGGGGGGGSSYVEPKATAARMWRGWKTSSNGLVVLSW